MDLIQAIILGVIQGATEFLPVSSSGHLVLAPWWFGWSVPPDLVFDVAVHLGTLCAVLVYFWRDWLDIARGALHLLQTRRMDDLNSRLFVYLVVASIPVGIAGALLVNAMH
ncbi:MAG: undecaprenyl-diphosphate phosphatase, partial [Anaerolineae bacterium]|nr:undecaprenyl-diphosphate phosphatase [Anaerolineae bacterium]